MDPLSRINLSASDILAAQDAVGVQQGFLRDTNNFAPRFGFAYEIFGDGKTVVRGALGLFYDHPLLAAAFNSDIADAAQQQQAVLTAGNPAPTSLLNAAQVFQGTVCVPDSTSNPICPAGVNTPEVLNSQLAGSLRTPGTVSPFGAVNAQVSDGNSSYNAFNLELKRRLANNFTFLASYILSHSIDDSSDLQTLLIRQDVNNFAAEKADSLFHQRHRFVFSGVLASPNNWRNSDNLTKKIFADFTLAPIIEISSGRPFNIITNVDANNDQATQTDRPSVSADGIFCVPGTIGCTPLITNGQFSTGDLGRNRGITHSYASVNLRLTRAIHFGERVRLDLIAEGFNLFNRFNEAAATPFFTDVKAFGQRDSGGRYFSRPTASFDPRQFQFGFKLNF